MFRVCLSVGLETIDQDLCSAVRVSALKDNKRQLWVETPGLSYHLMFVPLYVNINYLNCKIDMLELVWDIKV